MIENLGVSIQIRTISCSVCSLLSYDRRFPAVFRQITFRFKRLIFTFSLE